MAFEAVFSSLFGLSKCLVSTISDLHKLVGSCFSGSLAGSDKYMTCFRFLFMGWLLVCSKIKFENYQFVHMINFHSLFFQVHFDAFKQISFVLNDETCSLQLTHMTWVKSNYLNLSSNGYRNIIGTGMRNYLRLILWGKSKVLKFHQKVQKVNFRWFIL